MITVFLVAGQIIEIVGELAKVTGEIKEASISFTKCWANAKLLDLLMLKVIRTTSDNDHFKSLNKILDNELNGRYGIAQAKMDFHNKMESNETVVIGYDESVPIACGSFKSFDNDTVEIKRMFVKSENRGSGIASLILQELEIWANEIKISKCILETGIKQPEAIKFYTKMGYSKISNYGQYINNPNSICMLKELAIKATSPYID